jgi:hypothetical protein
MIELHVNIVNMNNAGKKFLCKVSRDDQSLHEKRHPLGVFLHVIGGGEGHE